uniref:angio-associated migratory cell protein isoform X2 n=1 Tax=Myxine glutinosa TaxID=7769 RepID=UPI00358E67B6
MAGERPESPETLNVLNSESDDENMFEVIDLDQCDSPGDLTNAVCDVDLEDESDIEGGANDDSDLTVSLHDGSVFCVVLGPGDHPLAVTGGEDNRAFVWRVGDGSTVFECSGHKDSVTCVGFSHDGSLLATGDMGGILKVWRTDCWQEVWSFEVGDLEWMEWHRHAPVLCAGTADGSVWLWKLPEGKTKMFQGPGCPTTCGTLLPDGSRAAIGYEDGTLRIWDLKRGLPLHTFKGSDFHQLSLTCLSCDPNGDRVLTGSLDGTARLLSPTSGKVLQTFQMEALGCQSSDSQSDCISVESVGFCHVIPLIAVGFLSGEIAVWDLPTHSLRHRINAGAGVVRLRWELSSAGLLAGCLNGTVSIWDALTGGLASRFHGHTQEVLDFALTSDATAFVTASGDGTSKTFCLRQV